MKATTPELIGPCRNPRRASTRGRAGFTLTELMVMIAVLGSLFTIAIPFFLSYYQAAAVKSTAQQVVALFNQARELAIQTNSTNGVCVRLPSNTQMRFIQGGCGGTVWVGAGTDAAGNFNLPAGFTLGPATDVVFDYLGAAQPAVNYTLTKTIGGTALTIRVAVSGQVKVGSP